MPFTKVFGMSAYVIVEASVRDKDSLDGYAAQSGPILREVWREDARFGPFETLFGEPAFDNGMIFHFETKDAALAWYNSPAYQALLSLRNVGIDCRFRLIG
jgi:uncharacterized protein (DUF1330 family)